MDFLKYKQNPKVGFVCGLVGIAIAAVGLFYHGLWLGIVAALFGAFGLFAGERKAAYLALFFGIIVLILALV